MTSKLVPPRTRLGNAFGRVCVCLSVLFLFSFESLDIETLFLVRGYPEDRFMLTPLTLPFWD